MHQSFVTIASPDLGEGQISPFFYFYIVDIPTVGGLGGGKFKGNMAVLRYQSTGENCHGFTSLLSLQCTWGT